ncbi:ABC transporter substrate-binding protein [Kineosporia babensis]|uniref:Extracellular solute-binding protein n=1 Tax=Kineosporia babensis TaxID=499548 RepID=A0A9X1SWX4_9ACTN|nr:extracellular solute-binding protein [Kineosporia babensis]MCD5314515.1 extracellular solute-binding protein [Kineosporia babensis]
MLSIRATAALTFAGLAGIGLLSACGSDSEGDEAAGGKVSITVASDAGLTPEAIASFDQQIASFKKTHPNIEVVREEYTWTGPTFAAKLAGGTLPDVFTVPFTDGRTLIARRQVADISEEVAELPYAGQFNETVIAAGQSEDGKISMLPTAAYGQALHYNRALFEEAGLDPDQPPTSWSEIRSAAKQIADRTGQAGYSVMTKGNTGGWILSTEAYAMGGRMSQAEGEKQKATIDNPGAKQALNLIRSMRWEDNSMGSNFGYDWNSINQAFAAGKIGMYVTGGTTYENLVAQNEIEPSEYGLSVLPLEGTDAGVLGGGTLAAVSVKASEAERKAAVEWIDFFYMQKLITEDGAKRDAENRQAEKQPVGTPQLPVFDQATEQQRQGWIADYVDVPLEQMSHYTEAAAAQPLVPEPPVATQDLYAALDPVVQKVLTDQNANVDELLAAANTEVQTIFDRN